MSLRKIVLYVYGPYSGDMSRNIDKARRTAIEAWEAGFTVICPHLNTSHFEEDCKIEYNDYIQGDLEIIRRCDGLLASTSRDRMVTSAGAMQEEGLAKADGIPVFQNLQEVLSYEWH